MGVRRAHKCVFVGREKQGTRSWLLTIVNCNAHE